MFSLKFDDIIFSKCPSTQSCGGGSELMYEGERGLNCVNAMTDQLFAKPFVRHFLYVHVTTTVVSIHPK
jgi:hypothetical protein